MQVATKKKVQLPWNGMQILQFFQQLCTCAKRTCGKGCNSSHCQRRWQCLETAHSSDFDVIVARTLLEHVMNAAVSRWVSQVADRRNHKPNGTAQDTRNTEKTYKTNQVPALLRGEENMNWQCSRQNPRGEGPHCHCLVSGLVITRLSIDRPMRDPIVHSHTSC
jgi:hypothetical protein